MADTFKLPNGGYNIVICRKQDILDCIEENIIDKDIALSVVEQCELDAANFISQSRWAGIPFIGNIRVPKPKLMEQDPAQQALINEAKELLDAKQYIMFRKQLSSENYRQAKYERYFNYITSIAVNKNKKLYKKLCNEKGEHYAKIYLFSCANITSVDNEYVILDDNE